MARRGAKPKANAVPVRGGWVLPHGMGVQTAAQAESATQAATGTARATRSSTRNAQEGSHMVDPEHLRRQSPAKAPPKISCMKRFDDVDRREGRKRKFEVTDALEEEADEVARQLEQEVEASIENNKGGARAKKQKLEVPNQAEPLRRSARVRARLEEEVEHVPEQSHAGESQPEELKPQPQESKQEEVQPEEAQPAVARPEEAKPEEAPTEESQPEESLPKPARRGRKRVKTEDSSHETGQSKPPRQRRKRVKVVGKVDEDQPEKPKRIPRKTKDNPYGLMPGKSPFPEWEAPSAEQCEVVYRILADMHDDVQPQSPEVIPAPSLEVTGCGEVPFVLEALIRTLLSGAVTFAGAAKMLKGIVSKYGVLEDGVAKGSIDWNKVRLSPIEDLIEAIHEGGLASIKAKAIKGILDMVRQENLDRRAAYLAERETGVPADVYGAAEKSESQKDLEILKADQEILSLDHMRGLSADDAMREFTKYPGIGVKTAACVILFCLQIPCFAVDTHVHRFSKWLGWTPPKADENDTFCHLEVRCPDHLKYGLHQLFIRHGQTCSRCKASTAEGTKEWDSTVCPLEHLLTRAKKMAKIPKGPKKKAGDTKAEGTKAEDNDGIKDEGEDDIEAQSDLEDESKSDVDTDTKVETHNDIKNDVDNDVQDKVENAIKDEDQSEIREEIKNEIIEGINNSDLSEGFEVDKANLVDDIKKEDKTQIGQVKNEITEDGNDTSDSALPDDDKANFEIETKNKTKNDIKNEITNEIKDETKDEITNEITNGTKNDTKNETNNEDKTGFKEEIKEEINQDERAL
ncbi:hypothetical protein GGS20DRAFT_584501 [Poronia punctata]|nr:hypothetical protein GGS20DRAFT_584501 [Poronia punctata]